MRALVLLLALALVGCTSAANAPVAAQGDATSTIVAPAATAVPPPTQTPTALAPTLAPTSAAPSQTPTTTATPTPEPTVPPTATPIPTPDAVAGITISDLRARSYGSGAITIGELWNYGAGYTTYRIYYPADGLNLTGLIHIPAGDGPFPVIIANRGYIAPEVYQPGMDSRAFADFMARNGYLVLAPDYRGYGGGDNGPNPFYTGYYADILNLIPLARALPQARPGKIGMWGHSRGASITVAAATITNTIAAAVAYAPAPADLAVDYARRYAQSGGNPGSDTFPFPPEANPDAYARVSPINYFEGFNAPLMLHHGTADTVVDASASTAMHERLKAAGKDVTLHLYEGGGHTLVGAQDALYLQRTLEFFRAHGL